jgi:phage terminase large subunit
MRKWPKLGKIWLPPDAKAKTFQSRYTTAEQFITGFGAQRVGVIPPSTKRDQINAARTVIRKCEFHEDNCEKGLDGLRAWAFKWDPDLQIFTKEPEHNWASHPGDGYAYGCQIMQTVKPSEPEKPGRTLQIGTEPPDNQVTLEDLWDQHERKLRRRR